MLVFTEINQESLINGLVHGSLVAIIVLISFCLTCYAQLKGLMRPSVLAGLLVYWIGTVVMSNAGLISGFVVPHLATMVDLTSTTKLDIFTDLKRLSWAMNQAFANFGSVCWCLTMFFWAKAIYDGETNNKIFAILSFSAGAFLTTALLTGWISLIVLGMTIVMLSIRSINAMYYPLCHLNLRLVVRVSNGYFSEISKVIAIKKSD